MRTFLFGAGASHSYNLSPTGLKPPLARDFFQTFRNLDIAADRLVRVGDIINYVRDTRGLNPIEFGDWEENIEDFLTEIDEKIGTKEAVEKLSFEDMLQFGKAYDQMLFLFTSVLNEIQNGPTCPNYLELCSKLQSGDTLVTFNWDTLLDRALNETGIWFPDDGYGLAFKKIFRNGWEKLNPGKKSAHQFLKLHGSTNWIMPHITLNYQEKVRVFSNSDIDPLTRPMFCFHEADKEFITYQNRSKSGYQPFSYYYYPPDIPAYTDIPARTNNQVPPGMVRISMVAAPDVPEYGRIQIGGSPNASMPLIIPPLRNKQYGLLGNALDGLWESAQHAITQCEELIIIGYSFPVTDIRAWELFEKGVLMRTSILPIHLVDPYPDQLAKRLEEGFGDKINLRVSALRFDQVFEAGVL